MARDGGGGGPQAVEGRRVALRALLAGGETVRPAGKGLLRGLRCTSEAAAQAFEPEAASRPSADWRGLGCTSAAAASQVHTPAAADWRRRGSRERRKARGGGGAGVGGDVWCAPGIPFAAEASSVDCVVVPHPHQSTVGARRRAQAERSHREVRKKILFLPGFLVLVWSNYDMFESLVILYSSTAANPAFAVVFLSIIQVNLWPLLLNRPLIVG
jgi:hypothetical protein